ncbi:MAG: CoB--CoM heterodisulfide reductase iron-sulfur subunit B family protein [Bacillota bacterium]
MKYSYFPGCTLHQQARDFDMSTREAARKMGIDLVELEDWQCCGAVFPLATDAIIYLVSPYRTLASSHEAGTDLVTLCSGCLNVLRRTNRLVKTNKETRAKLQAFVEKDYQGERHVYHLLEVIRKDTTFEGLAQRIIHSLEGLKVASYYGCLLLRPPEEMEFDDVESPTIMEEFTKALGAEPVDFPFKTECCGAYLSVPAEDRTLAAARSILRSASSAGADIMVTSCPMCLYNLDAKQGALARQDTGFRTLPVVYFSQLLALALGAGEDVCGFDAHEVDPRPLLREKMLIPEVN